MIELVTLDADELDRLVRIHNAVRPDDPTNAEEMVDWKRQTDDTVWLVAVSEGEDAGAGVGIVGWHTAPGTGLLEIWTLPHARGRGAGLALLERLGDWCAVHGCTAVQTEVAEDDASSLAWAERRGFVEVGRSSRLVLDLEEVEAPPIDPPEGIEIASWAERPGIERQLYEVALEAEPDIPGEESNELAPFEQWLENDMRGLSDRPEGVFVAFHGEEVVGYAKLAFPAVETGEALHDLTGVRRDWRGRGIAGALKRMQIAWAKEQGLERLVTGNEQRNEPIRRLNVRHGYRVQPGTIRLRARLPTRESSPSTVDA